MKSVLQDWVMELPLRAQGTLLCAIRGCDLTPKYPLDSPERRLVSAIRYHVLVAADPREIDSEPGCFMSSEIPLDFKISALGHYPQHWVSHVMHAIEVLAYAYRKDMFQAELQAKQKWLDLYYKFCHALHVNHESVGQFEKRMIEDRIANGTVVS